MSFLRYDITGAENQQIQQIMKLKFDNPEEIEGIFLTKYFLFKNIQLQNKKGNGPSLAEQSIHDFDSTACLISVRHLINLILYMN